MKLGSLILPVLALAACSPDVRSLELAEVSFTDMDVVQEIRGKLPPEDRPAFGTYVIQHVVTSPSFCGEVLVDRSGREPRTIGEAIRLTVLREERLRRERVAAERPLTAAESLRRERNNLIDRKEALIARRTHLYYTHGAAAEDMPEWDEIAARMADYDAELRALQPKLDAVTG